MTLLRHPTDYWTMIQMVNIANNLGTIVPPSDVYHTYKP
jgi:hypothetical protein